MERLCHAGRRGLSYSRLLEDHRQICVRGCGIELRRLGRALKPACTFWHNLIYNQRERRSDMKGNEKIIALLNDFLADELTAISQYMVHSEMCANWGYKKLHKATEKRAIDEMKHAEKLIDRILFLEGQPIVSQLNKISIGADVAGQLKHDLEA